MALGDFDANYPSSPWGNITTNKRTWYQSTLLRNYFVKHMVYNRFVSTQFNLGDVSAKTMVLTNTISPHPNFNALGNTQKWMASSRIDSKSRSITFDHHGSKLAFEEYDLQQVA